MFEAKKVSIFGGLGVSDLISYGGKVDPKLVDFVFFRVFGLL
jgi:hypothetical protein